MERNLYILSALVMPLLVGTAYGLRNRDHRGDAATSRKTVSEPLLQPGDTLNVVVIGLDKLNGQYVVQKDRTVAIPYVGSVAAFAGTTAFRAQLRQQLGQSLFKDPTVLVGLIGGDQPAEAKSAIQLRQSEASTENY